MAKNDVKMHEIITEAYFNDDFKKCILIWEENNQIIFNEIQEEDVQLLEIISYSYLKQNIFNKALKLLNILIKYAKKDLKKNIDKCDFYLLQKSEIFRKENKLYLEYVMLAERKKLNQEPDFNEYIVAYEKYFSRRIITPIFVFIPIIIYLLFIIVVSYLHVLSLPEYIYMAIVVVGLVYFLFSLFFKKLFEKYIFSLFKKCALIFHC